MGLNSEPGFGGSRGFLEDMENVGALDQVIGEPAEVADAVANEAAAEQPSGGLLAGAKHIIASVDEAVAEGIKSRTIGL